MKNEPSHSAPIWLRAANLTAVTVALCLGQTAFAASSLNWSDRHFVNEAADSNHEELALAQLASQQASDPSVRAFAQQVVTDHRQLGQDLSQLAAEKSLALDSDITVMAPVAVNSSAQSNLGANAVVPLGGPNSSYSGANMGALTDTPTGNRIQAQGTPVSPGVTQASANPGSDLQTLATTGANMDGARSTQYQATSTTTTATMAPNPWDDRKYRRLARMNGTDFDREYVALTVSGHEEQVKNFDKKSRDASDPDVRAFASKELPTRRAHLDRAQSLAQGLK
jgi:putative membrane protein